MSNGLAASVLAAVLLASCVSAPDVDYEDLPDFFMVPLAETNLIDRRPEFAAVFCAEFPAALEKEVAGRGCLDYLHFDGLVDTIERGKLLAHSDIRFIVISGMGSECVEELVSPFEYTIPQLQEAGVDIDLMMVPARASTTYNAKVIADRLDSDAANAGKRIVLIGYSKGLPDALEGTILYPESFSNVVAIVSLAGVVNGTPIADDVGDTTRRMFENLPLSDCEAQEPDGDAILSLTYKYRQNWLNRNDLDPRIRYFSVAAHAGKDDMSVGLKGTYKDLAEIDSRNDGQMIYRDAIIPASFLLAVVNANHWAIALPIADANSFMNMMMGDNNDYPRSTLLRSIVIVVNNELNAEQGEMN